MFGKKKKQKEPVYDVTQKITKTWWGGTKLVPTTKSEQKKIRTEEDESRNSEKESQCHCS